MTSRIAQVAGFYAPTSGGLRTTVDALAGEYREAGHDPVLVVPGAATAECRAADRHRVEVRSPRLPGTAYRVLLDRGGLCAVLDRLAPDRVEVHDKVVGPAVGRWAAARGVPAVLVSHERLDGILAGRVPPGFPLRAAADLWNRRLTSVFDSVVCASAYAAAELERVGAPVTRIPLGVDLDAFQPGGRSWPPVIAAVGRLSAEKRPDLAISAFRQVLRMGLCARLVLVGDGPARTRLERSAVGLPVTFTGHLDRRGVAGVLAGASVLVAPCPVETFGLAVLEGLASGTPVVAADRGGAPELIAAGTGVAVSPTSDALAGALAELLDGDLETMGRAARQRAAGFTWRATADAMLAVHQLGNVAQPC